MLADVQRLVCPTLATLGLSLWPLCPDPACGHLRGHVHVLVHSPLSCCVILGKSTPSLSLQSLLQPAGIMNPCLLQPKGQSRPETKKPQEQSSPKRSVPNECGLSTGCLSRSQDEMELGYVQAPHKTFPVVFDSPRNGELQDFPYKRILVSGPGHRLQPGSEGPGTLPEAPLGRRV